MKLRPKSVVIDEVARERKQQIDDGLKIAKKVDALRQTLADLEAQHDKFIAGMKGELEKETSGLLTQIAELKAEIGELEEKRRILLEPLDTAWAEVEAEKNKLLVLTQSLETAIGKNERLESLRKEKLQEAKDALSRIKIRERELIKVYAGAEEDRGEAQKIREQAEQDKAKQEATLTEKFLLLEKREKQAIFDEGANAHQKELNQKRYIALNDREKAINDKYETLLRTEKQINGRKRI